MTDSSAAAAAAANEKKSGDLVVKPITDPSDVALAFDTCVLPAFGHQTHDAIWAQINPGWDTPEGHARGRDRMVARFLDTSGSSGSSSSSDPPPKDIRGNLTTVFVKATLPPPASEEGEKGKQQQQLDSEGRLLAGLAIWVQHSLVPGHGVAPSSDAEFVFGGEEGLEKMWPGQKGEQKYLCQMIGSLTRKMVEVCENKKAKGDEEFPDTAIFHLDLCATNPELQRKGAASGLTRWGIEEAKRRGGSSSTGEEEGKGKGEKKERYMDLVTEASAMGRLAYEKCGFRNEGEIEYVVDEEFRGRERPSNAFMTITW